MSKPAALPPFVEHAEFARIQECPEVDAGGYLQRKEGELCLRECDRFEVQPGGKLRVTRTWRRGKFKPELYEERKEGE